MRTIQESLRLAVPLALLAVAWSCAGEVQTTEQASYTTTCEECCDAEEVDDPDPDCERSLCDTGPTGYCRPRSSVISAR
jgi:hypothetical protein